VSFHNLPERLVSRLQITLSQISGVNEVQIEVHSKNGLLDFVLVHARSGDHVFRHVDGADRQIFFLDPFIFFA
jgi:hypothetical protein